MSSKAVRALYRSFWRTIQGLERQGVEVLDIRTPVNKEAWMFQGGSHGWAPPRGEFHLAALKALVPWAAEGASSGSLSPADLRQLVRHAFRHPPEGSSRGEQLDRAFQSLRHLVAQIHMHECSSSCATEGVHVEVTTAYVGAQAQLDPTYEAEEGVPQKQYFTYRIRVSNCSSDTVQLLGRHWVIQGPGGEVLTEVPKGSRGVVGCTPLLEPGACFEYYSGADLEGGSGSMHGSFQMAAVDPDRPTQHLRTFDALVAPFQFKRPGAD